MTALNPNEELTPTGPSNGVARVRIGFVDPSVFSKTQNHSGADPKSGRLTICNSSVVIVSRICKYLGMTRLIAVH